MPNRMLLALAAVALCTLGGSVGAQEKQGTLQTQADLQNLYRTGVFQDFAVVATGAKGSAAFVPDGSTHLLMLTKDGRVVQDTGAWRIAGDTFCIQWKALREGKEHCFHYYKTQENQYESWFAADGKPAGRYTLR